MTGIIALFIFAALLTGTFVGWRIFLDQRRRRRRELYQRLALALGMHCRDQAETVPEAQPESLAETDGWLWGERDGFRVDIYERLSRHRPIRTPVETQTIIDISHLGVTLPAFVITPDDDSKRFWHKHVGLRPVVILGDVSFSQCNRVEGKDSELIVEFLGPEVTEILHGNELVNVESNGTILRFYQYEQLLPQDRIKELLELGMRFAAAAKARADALGPEFRDKLAEADEQRQDPEQEGQGLPWFLRGKSSHR